MMKLIFDDLNAFFYERRQVKHFNGGELKTKLISLHEMFWDDLRSGNFKIFL